MTELRGLDRRTLATGARYLQLHHYADDEKQDEWLEQVRREMADTPNDFKREILMMEVTGHPYFDNEALAELLKRCPKPKWNLGLPHHTKGVHQTLSRYLASEAWAPAQDIPDTLGRVEFWAKPIPGLLYVVSADPAMGLSLKGNPDSCSLKVFEAMSWDEVACAEGKWDTHEFGMIIASLGWFYNTAMLAVEFNTHGEAALHSIEHVAKYPEAVGEHMGPGIYYHSDWKDRIDQAEKTRRPGWPTTSARNKTLALDFLAVGLANGTLTIRDRRTIAQMMRFVHLPGGKYGGDAGSHDDNVLAAAIGAAVLNLRPIKTVFREGDVPVSPYALDVMAEFAARNENFPQTFDPYEAIRQAAEDENYESSY